VTDSITNTFLKLNSTCRQRWIQLAADAGYSQQTSKIMLPHAMEATTTTWCAIRYAPTVP